MENNIELFCVSSQTLDLDLDS